MTSVPLGSKEKQLRELKARKAAKSGASLTPSAKGLAEATAAARHAPAKSRAKGAQRRKASPRPPQAPRPAVPARDVAELICRPAGASMAELEKAFGIRAHPMRAKIHYARHNLGYRIEVLEGRYHGERPKGKA